MKACLQTYIKFIHNFHVGTLHSPEEVSPDLILIQSDFPTSQVLKKDEKLICNKLYNHAVHTAGLLLLDQSLNKEYRVI